MKCEIVQVFDFGKRGNSYYLAMEFVDGITVHPSVEMAASFSNDIGLDLDLSGTFKAFSLKLSAFGKEVFGVDADGIGSDDNAAKMDVALAIAPVGPRFPPEILPGSGCCTCAGASGMTHS